MGWAKVSRLTDQEIISRYQDGEARGLVALRAGIPDYKVVEVLTRHGIALRTPCEVKRQMAMTKMAMEMRRSRRRR